MKPEHVLRFDYVVVIESLRSGDPKTGQDLYDLVIRPLCDKKGLKHRFKAISTRPGFFAFLSELENECRAGGHSPLLHIECHGSDDGLEIAGESVSWAELKPLLIGLNVVSRLNLLVCLAACSGASLVKVLLPIDRAPVWGVIGPHSPGADPGDLLRDFGSFYTELLVSFDGRAALIRMNGGPPGPTWRYAFTTAPWFFKQVYGEYLRTHANPTALRKRARTIARMAAKASPRVRKDRARSGLKEQLANQQPLFERFRTLFFMYDLFPAHLVRFPVSYADIAP
jgi:hypothetical protein